MADHPVAALLCSAATCGPGLLVLDENPAGALPLPPPQWRALANRCDVQHQTQARGWDCICNDFEFSGYGNLQRAAYRVSKEKRVVEHVLQALWQTLAPGGELWIAGYKQEGIKTFAARAAAAWQAIAMLQRGDGGLHLYRFTRGEVAPMLLNEQDYHALMPVIECNGLTLYSKPGIFAWDRIDAGSAFLLAQLPAFLEGRDGGTLQALDLGCGYGLLALVLLRAGCARVFATDNNAAAVAAAQRNLALVADQERFEVSLQDCADGLHAPVDLVLCNPPFHQGFTVEGALTDRFLAAARRLLKPGGEALFVVNAFIPLERKAAPLFADVRTLASDRSFKVLALRR